MGITTPDPNGSRICNQRWNHKDELTVMDGEDEWCPICLDVMKPKAS